MKKVLIWFSGGNNKRGLVKWVQFLNQPQKFKAHKGRKLAEGKIWSMGGINTLQQNSAT